MPRPARWRLSVNVAAERIAVEAAAYGILRTAHTPGQPSMWKVSCSKCDNYETHNWANDYQPRGMVSRFRHRGWVLLDKTPPMCRDCSKGVKTLASTSIGPDPKIARKIYALLDEHFDDVKRLYRSPWNDQRIAKTIDISPDIVMRIRKEAYGELAEDPALQGFRDDLEIIRMEAVDLQDRFNKELASHLTKINELEGKISNHRKIA